MSDSHDPQLRRLFAEGEEVGPDESYVLALEAAVAEHRRRRHRLAFFGVTALVLAASALLSFMGGFLLEAGAYLIRLPERAPDLLRGLVLNSLQGPLAPVTATFALSFVVFGAILWRLRRH